MSQSTLERRKSPAHARTPTPREIAERKRRRQRMYERRRIFVTLLFTLLVFFGWLSVSLGGALMNPSFGSSISARLAEWARLHGASSIVNWAENQWYGHHPPPVGGRPPAGAIRLPSGEFVGANTRVPHLPPPTPMTPFASPAIAGEGQWSPIGRRVDGYPTMFETTLRPDGVHTSYVAAVAWMDTRLLHPTLYSGSWIPGGGPYPNTAPIQPSDARTVVAAFNAGFLMSDANGGYYTNHHTIIPLRRGAASFVIYRDGRCNIGAWGHHLSMTSDVVSVRQNLALLVRHGKLVPGLQANDKSQWGVTLGNSIFVWRSGIGITKDGALVYVAGPGLNITDLAHLLVRAGAVRAMELDINQDWVNFSWYQPSSPTGLAGPSNGTELLPSMTGTTARYFESWWTRDFFTMSTNKS